MTGLYRNYYFRVHLPLNKLFSMRECLKDDFNRNLDGHCPTKHITNDLNPENH